MTAFLLGACSGNVSPASSGNVGTTEHRTQESTDAATTSFINKVWRVSESSAVAVGTLYVFLSDGTLVITSPNSKPALGTWKHEGNGLVMIEESIPYKTDILKLSAGEFRIKSNNPGGAVEITLVLADAASPPK